MWRKRMQNLVENAQRKKMEKIVQNRPQSGFEDKLS